MNELFKFYTKPERNIFETNIFRKWLNTSMSNVKNKIILEPFAGSGNIIKLFKEIGDYNFKSFDIEPKQNWIIKRDTIKSYPKNYEIAITNPPFLAKNSAKRKGLEVDFGKFDDIYKVSLDLMLKNNKYVAAIVPANIINDLFFQKRMSNYILLNIKMFDKTTQPVALVLFEPDETKNIMIREINKKNEKTISNLKTIQYNIKEILEKKNNAKIKFNVLEGQYGILATDKSYPSIKFVRGNLISNDKVKPTSRNIIKFQSDRFISIPRLNHKLELFFHFGGEYLLSTFKGLMKNGHYRRRIDFKTIKKIFQSMEI